MELYDVTEVTVPAARSASSFSEVLYFTCSLSPGTSVTYGRPVALPFTGEGTPPTIMFGPCAFAAMPAPSSLLALKRISAFRMSETFQSNRRRPSFSRERIESSSVMMFSNGPSESVKAPEKRTDSLSLISGPPRLTLAFDEFQLP